MKRIATLIFCLFIALPVALAQEAFTIDGEPFTRKFVGNAPNGDKLIEFVRQQESFEQWTKLIGLRFQQLPKINNDPVTMALAMAQVVKARDSRAQSVVRSNKEKTEAIIDFLTGPPKGDFIEFNVFRYIKSRNGKGVISLQFAYRFPGLTKENVEAFKKLRISWIKQVAAYDMNRVHRALAR